MYLTGTEGDPNRRCQESLLCACSVFPSIFHSMQFSKAILLLISSFVMLISACRSDQSSNGATQPSQAAQPAQTIQPSVSPAPARQKTAVDPKAEAKVPESLKRPLTADEMQKAFQKLPSSARAQIRGAAPAPPETRNRQLSKPPANK
jgi:hypothetical protein